MPGHIDVSNHRFDVEYLKKLIKSTTNDLEEADKQRRDDFKKYEMEKKFEKEERLRHISDEEARKKEEQRLAELEKKHKDHEKLKHPMTKDQLEEVWEEQDHMQPEDWDPKTFFAMHDFLQRLFLPFMNMESNARAARGTKPRRCLDCWCPQ